MEIKVGEGWTVEIVNPTALGLVLEKILLERTRQDKKWGEQNHQPEKWLVILQEEVGEAAKATLEGSALQYHDELVHVAAVAVAALESLSRGKWAAEREKRGAGG